MTALLGRRNECTTLDRLVTDVSGGTSRVLVLRGEAGTGKSALLNYLAQGVGARSTVLSATGAEAEMELPYSGLHQLCAPLIGRIDGLPGPQRTALATVFGLSAGPAPDRFLVGLATLSLLADAAEQQPVLVLVDDAQWLDQATAGILAFVARRLLAERIALVCAARVTTVDDVLPSLPELTVEGLDDATARALLDLNLPGALDAGVREQILAESRGNPLALIELPRTRRPEALAGGFGLPGGASPGGHHPEGTPLAGRIEQSYAERARRLPADTQLLVLAAAAEPLGDPVLLQEAGRRLGVDLAATLPAADAGLLRVGGRVQFAHPLVRSAVYRGATLAERQRVHKALAEATDAGTDPDRRAWHRARAAPGPDEEVAAELERSAGRAQSRAGLSAAAAFLTRAAELTPDRATRRRRALDAAFASVAAGGVDTARTLLSLATAGLADDRQQARADLLRAQIAYTASRGKASTPLLLAAARRLEPLDPALARATYLDALIAAQIGSRLNDGITARDVAEVALAALPAPGPKSAVDLLLAAYGALTEDYEKAVPACRDAVRALRGEDNLRWLWAGMILAIELWDEESWDALSERHLRLARAAGALTELPFMLSGRVHLLGYRGQMSAAEALVAEESSVFDALGAGPAAYGELGVLARRGEERQARELLEVSLRAAVESDEGTGIALSECWHALLCNGLGQYEEALDAAVRATENPREFSVQNWGLPELIEAAARTGHTDLARDGVARLAAKAVASGSVWALGLAARGRALITEGDEAEGYFRAAVEQLSQTGARADLARAHLLYGEWLRRASRRADAKRELGVAYELFSTMGLAGFAERTRRELLALGGAPVRQRAPETRVELTAQEAHIARLAKEGRSNPEIGAQLFLSARTVEWHLRKVFGKLDISSRRQLRSVTLPSDQRTQP